MELVLAERLPSVYPTLCCEEIWESSKIRLLTSLCDFSQALDAENFATTHPLLLGVINISV